VALALQLHRCGTPWKFGPCWKVQKALDDQRIAYQVVVGPRRPKNRATVIEGTGQPLYPAIRFEDGRWYRDESKEMAPVISEGRLMEEQQGGVAGSLRRGLHPAGKLEEPTVEEFRMPA
jgi:hypothetical protein